MPSNLLKAVGFLTKDDQGKPQKIFWTTFSERPSIASTLKPMSKPLPGKPVIKEVTSAVREPVKELSDNELAEQNLLAKIERLKKMPDQDHPQVKAAIERTELYLQNIRQRINEE